MPVELTELPDDCRDEVNSRWLERILDVDELRHPTPTGRGPGTTGGGVLP